MCGHDDGDMGLGAVAMAMSVEKLAMKVYC